MENLEKITTQSVHAFREQFLLHKPNGIVVAGSGIEHEALVELADANFGHIKSDPNIRNDPIIPSIYSGGEYRLQIPPNPNPAIKKEEFTHVAIAFEVAGWHSPDLVPVCVLQTLLGGGSSFSAGGPGKGMYSRLYREVLNRYRWAESTEAIASFHNESGLWGIQGSAPPDKIGDLTKALVENFQKLADELVTDEELSRARNMLKCNVLTQLESRVVLFEDIGRQILTYGEREDAASMCAKIDAVTKETIRAIVQKAIVNPPTVSAVGVNIDNVPNLGEITAMFDQSNKKRKTWFS
jgi:processing peptidase subunit alpha